MGPLSGPESPAILSLHNPRINVASALPASQRLSDARLHAVSRAAAGHVPAFARLAEISGCKRLYPTNFVPPGLASASCGLPSTPPWLIGPHVPPPP